MPAAWHQPFLEAFEEHGTVVAAAREAGVTRQAAYYARQHDEHFEAAWAEVDARVVWRLEDELTNLAINGGDGGRVRALEILLKARRPLLYSDKLRVAHSGSIDHPATTNDLGEATDEELAAIVAEAERARGTGDPQ